MGVKSAWDGGANQYFPTYLLIVYSLLICGHMLNLYGDIHLHKRSVSFNEIFSRIFP